MLRCVEDSLTRRSLLASFAVAAVAERTLPWAWARRPEPPLRGGTFAEGVMAGLPHRHGVTLWTRVEGVERSGSIAFEIASDPAFGRVVHRGRTRVAALRDFTAKQRVLAPRALQPGTDYWYRFATADSTSPVGHFRTRRPPDSREPVRIAFFSCQGWEAGYYTAHAGLAREEDIDLVVSLGDYIYEETDDVGPRPDRTGANRDGNAQTLADYREKYRLYRSDADLRAMHAAHAFVPIPDDHDIESGYSATEPGETQGFPRRVPFTERKRAALLAMFEHMPIPRIGSDRDRLYRFLRIGANAELFLTDLHRYASPYPCRSDPKLGPISVVPCNERWDPARSMLGVEQKRRLKAGLRNSGATWKVWGSTLMMQGLEFAPGSPFSLGAWDGFAAERSELMEFVLRERIDDLVVVSGDIHTFFAGQVTTTGSADSQTGALEFVGGSISSEGIPDTIADERYKDQLGAFTDNVLLLNPHMAYADTKRRGYCVLECRPGELIAELRSPKTTLEPRSEVETIARFRVARGSRELERLA